MKIIKINSNEDLKQKTFYIINKENSTAIEVPHKILETFKKVHRNHAFIDSLAQAVNLRRSSDIYNRVEVWDKRAYKYAPYRENYSFDKFISTISGPLTDGSIKLKEIDLLITFFCQCPHGYNVTPLIRPHSELCPVIT